MGTVLAVIGYVLLGVLVLVLLVPLFPVFVRVTFEDDLCLRVYLLGIPIIRCTPQPETEASKPRQVKSEPKPGAKKPSFWDDLAKSLKEDGVRTVLRQMTDLAKLAGGVLHRVFRGITVDRLRLALTVASGEAADTAQNCGKVCAVLYPVLSALQLVLRIRRREVTVTPDFLAEKGQARADVLIHAVPYRLLFAVLWALPAFWKWKKALQSNHEEEQVNG